MARTYLKCIGVWTPGMMQEPPEVREYLETWLARTTQEDWFYAVDYHGKRYFLADNGEFGYTAMLPDEYERTHVGSPPRRTPRFLPMPNTTWICDSCEEPQAHNARGCFLATDGRYCDVCAERYTRYCSVCEERYTTNDLTRTGCCDALVCEGCSDGHDNCRDDADDIPYRSCDEDTCEYLSDKTGKIIRSLRPFGVEIECLLPHDAAYDVADALPRAVGITSDGSISGDGCALEFQTPRLSGKTGERTILDITKVLNTHGASVNASTGLHVHLDAQEFHTSPDEEEQENADACSGIADVENSAKEAQRLRFTRLKTLMLLYVVFDDVIRAMLPRSRRINNYCKQVSGAFHLTELMDTNTAGDIEKLWYRTMDTEQIKNEKRMKGSATRYHGVNLHALLHAGHLEIRYHSGTTSATKILHWTALHQAIVDTAARKTDNAYAFWQDILTTRAEVSIVARFQRLATLVHLTPATKEYLLSRMRLFWNGAEEEK